MIISRGGCIASRRTTQSSQVWWSRYRSNPNFFFQTRVSLLGATRTTRPSRCRGPGCHLGFLARFAVLETPHTRKASPRARVWRAQRTRPACVRWQSNEFHGGFATVRHGSLGDGNRAKTPFRIKQIGGAACRDLIVSHHLISARPPSPAFPWEWREWLVCELDNPCCPRYVAPTETSVWIRPSGDRGEIQIQNSDASHNKHRRLRTWVVLWSGKPPFTTLGHAETY